MKNKTLIVIDYQNDFVYGSLGSPAAQAIKPNVDAKIKEAHKNGDHIIFTHDTHHDDYMDTFEGKNLPVPHCIEGTEGWKIVGGFDGIPCVSVSKNTFGTFDWFDVLANHDVIELIGVCSDICVVSNALILRAMFPDSEIIVDASCCAGTSKEAHDAAMLVMKSCQINVIGE